MTNALVLALILSVFLIVSSVVILKTNVKNKPLKKQMIPSHIILPIKNHAAYLEGTIHTVADIYAKLHQTPPNVIILDTNSKDDSILIANILSKKYDFIQIMSMDKYKEFLNTL
ncbi:MAG: glycosyltransferase family 2 protein [Clostridia bacterium]|nr:glycosyltransferase family 2 protein [Clostridia bacterium]